MRFLARALCCLVGMALTAVSQHPESQSAARENGADKPGTGPIIQTVFLPGDVPLELVWVQPGTFLMDCPEEAERSDHDSTHCDVSIERGFWMGRYEITQAQWQAIMNSAPWDGMYYVSDNPDAPASYISWEMAQTFIATINDVTGKNFRLPTEAEWEYAARAGTSTRYYWGGDPEGDHTNDFAWYRANAWDALRQEQRHPRPVGQKAPNAWGFYDMAGNVQEWCQDLWVDADPKQNGCLIERVVRGGAFNSGLAALQSASRAPQASTSQSTYTGLRICLEEEPEPDTAEQGETLPDESSPEAKPGEIQTILLPGGVPLEMLWIPPGSFLMGRYEGEEGSDSSEDPQRRVTIALGFWLGKYEITKAQWQAVMKSAPWVGEQYVINDPDSAAVYITWDDAKHFVYEMNRLSGLNFRLPSEAEWEYACRAGTSTRYYWGDDPDHSLIEDYARFGIADPDSAYADVAGRKKPNPWGLYDMSGNVWEWCEDTWAGDYTGAPSDGSPRQPEEGHWDKVRRGGGWHDEPGRCRSAAREYNIPATITPYRCMFGLRLAR